MADRIEKIARDNVRLIHENVQLLRLLIDFAERTRSDPRCHDLVQKVDAWHVGGATELSDLC